MRTFVYGFETCDAYVRRKPVAAVCVLLSGVVLRGKSKKKKKHPPDQTRVGVFTDYRVCNINTGRGIRKYTYTRAIRLQNVCIYYRGARTYPRLYVYIIYI